MLNFLLINILNYFLDEFWDALDVFPSIFTPEEKYYLLLNKPYTEPIDDYIRRVIDERNAGTLQDMPYIGNEDETLALEDEDLSTEFNGKMF